MSWQLFPYCALASFLLFVAGSVVLYSASIDFKRSIGHFLVLAGILVLLGFIIILWIGLDRPPFKTLGETRLWYAAFLSIVGYITFIRWKYWWFLAFSFAFASLFMLINILKPEAHDKMLMPALQSIWFIPHVIVYIFGYVLLAASSLVAAYDLYLIYYRKSQTFHLDFADNFVYLGFTFLTLGLLFGALWAKEAWGHYWTWDPKETWAFISWMVYLVYMHYRTNQPAKVRQPMWILSCAFIILLICWMGINYLPSAQNSVHTYAR